MITITITGNIVSGYYDYSPSEGEEVLVSVSGLQSVRQYVFSYQYRTDMGHTPSSESADSFITPGNFSYFR